MENNRTASWQSSFLNLMVLLFGVFVVLYSSQSINLRNIQKKIEVLKGNKDLVIQQRSEEPDAINARIKLEKLRDLLVLNFLKENAYFSLVRITIDNAPINQLRIETSQDDVFLTGDSNPRFSYAEFFEALGRALGNYQKQLNSNFQFDIEGYVDQSDSNYLVQMRDKRSKPNRFKNTWELSAARSAWIAQLWSKKGFINHNNIKILGISRYRLDPGQNHRHIAIVIE